MTTNRYLLPGGFRPPGQTPRTQTMPLAQGDPPPGAMAGGGPGQQVNQYGYGTAPGAGPGYYEQQTPVGSFVGAQWAGPTRQQFAQQQFGQAGQASNPYIGRTSTGVNQQDSVMPYAQQVASAATAANPYLGQQSRQAQGVGRNAYSGDNPYLQSQIDATTRNATNAFNDVVNPQFDRAAQQSGSFGNTGIEAARGRAFNDFGSNLASTIGGMRMQDYTQQQQLAENISV